MNRVFCPPRCGILYLVGEGLPPRRLSAIYCPPPTPFVPSTALVSTPLITSQGNAVPGLSPLQLKWLAARLDTETDAQASRVVNVMERLPSDLAVTKDRVRGWKRHNAFRMMLELARNNKSEAFRLLVAGSMTGAALKALDSLLTGASPFEKKEGLRAYMDIMKSGGTADPKDELLMELLRDRRPVQVVQVYTRGTGGDIIEGEVVG